MKIILIIFLFNICYADIKFKSELETTIVNLNNYKNQKETENYISTVLKIRHSHSISDNIAFRITPVISIYKTESDNKIYNINTLQEFKTESIFFRELYLTYAMNKHTVGFGLLPFSNNSFVEYQEDYIKQGEGLNTLVEADLINLFYMYNVNKELTIKLGTGKMSWLEFIPKGDYIMQQNSESSIYWLIADYNSNKWKSYSQFIYANGKYENQAVADVYVFGSGLAYDDSEYSGWVIYNTIGISHYRNKLKNKTELQNSILDNNNISRGTQHVFPESFGFNNDSVTGFSNLLGIRKDFDWEYEWFLNYEWFHTSDNWYSFNNGSIYDTNNNTAFNIRNNSHMLALGIRPSEKCLIKLYYTISEFEETSKIGFPPSTYDTNKIIGDRIKKTNSLKFQIKYRF